MNDRPILHLNNANPSQYDSALRYSAVYQEDQVAIPILPSNFVLNDVDSANLSQVVLYLSNPEVEDDLRETVDLPDGVRKQESMEGGRRVVRFDGSASVAAYRSVSE